MTFFLVGVSFTSKKININNNPNDILWQRNQISKILMLSN